jgi:hypothetical protein
MKRKSTVAPKPTSVIPADDLRRKLTVTKPATIRIAPPAALLRGPVELMFVYGNHFRNGDSGA